MVLFGMSVSNGPSNSTFIIYFRNKPTTPHICWNSCIPTPITSASYSKFFNFPIVATEVRVYIYGPTQSMAVDFWSLP